MTGKELGTMSVVAAEYENHRLPFLLGMRDKVNSGVPLNEGELEYMYRTLHIARLENPLTHGHPELEEFYRLLYHLYRDISALALDVEQVPVAG